MGLTFVVTHPIAHDLVTLVKDINEEAIERINNETVALLSGVTDRIAKATRPGKRKAKEEDRMIYAAVGLAEHILKGFKLDFADIPLEHPEHIKVCKEETAFLKTLKATVEPKKVTPEFKPKDDNNKAASRTKVNNKRPSPNKKVREE